MTKDLGKLWAERMTKSERDMSFADSEPRDAATLMLIDRSGAKPKVLLGRRHAGHKFMPGKFVFPGGRIEALDRLMPAVSELHPEAQKKLLERVNEKSPILRAPSRSPRYARLPKRPGYCSARNVIVRRTRPARSGPSLPKPMCTPISVKFTSSPVPLRPRAARGASTRAS